MPQEQLQYTCSPKNKRLPSNEKYIQPNKYYIMYVLQQYNIRIGQWAVDSLS